MNSLTRAFDYYLDASDQANAIALAEHPVPLIPAPGISSLIPKALTLVPPGSLSEGRLLAHYGFALGRVEGDYKAAQTAFDRALAIARYFGDARLELDILTRSADVDWFHLRLDESSIKSLEAIELASRTGDLHNEARSECPFDSDPNLYA